jgi:hypothetical protein
VVTEIGPVVAPDGTVATIWVSEEIVNEAAVWLNATPVAELKPVPVIVTEVPTTPEGGSKLEIVGAVPVTVKLVELVPVPPIVVTAIGPVEAPMGTPATIFE